MRVFRVDSDMEMAAIGIVADYIKEHLDKSNNFSHL